MPTEAYKAYRKCMKELVTGREDGSLDGDAEDRLLERMDNLWWQLSPKEMQALDRTPIDVIATRDDDFDGWS